MPVVIETQVPDEEFRGGATYKAIVAGESVGSPVFIGIQTAPPGYRSAVHSHPYQEVITVLDGAGEAWIAGSDEIVALSPGVTLVLPAEVRHWFRATGDRPLKIYGVHASPRRIVVVHEAAPG